MHTFSASQFCAQVTRHEATHASLFAAPMRMGFTDARVFRERGSVAYGAGLFDATMASGDFARRFHGHNERIDVESLRLTTEFWLDVVRDFDRQSP